MKQIIVDNISTNYYITEDGKCFNSITKKYLKGQINYKNNYLSYNLTMPDGTMRRFYAHRLVAIAYIPNDNKSYTCVNHKDGNKLNNCVDNLEWCNHSINNYHAVNNELRVYKHVFCFNKNKDLVAEYKTVQEAAFAAQITASQISMELNKEIKALTGGFYWSYDSKLTQVKSYPNTGKAKEVYQYDLNGKFINKYSSTGEAARSIGAKGSSHIGECCRGKIKTYKGFIWRYSEDIVSPSDESQRDASEAS